MNEAGIDISNNTSDFLRPDTLNGIDYVVTLCSSVRDRLPYLQKKTRHIHWEIENPDKIYPSEQARHYGFAAVRDEIEARVKKLLEAIENGDI
jgi:protein-tyrosine-phosphatase